MESISGKNFSITDPQGVNTVIYRINKTENYVEQNLPKYTVERLTYGEEINGTMKKKVFFIDEPREREQLVILSFGQDKVVVNSGIMENDKVKIAKKPIPIKFDTLYSEKEMEYKNFRYTPDPDTAEEVKPILYFDDKTNEVKGKCKLKPYKSYFSFEIRDKKEDQ